MYFIIMDEYEILTDYYTMQIIVDKRNQLLKHLSITTFSGDNGYFQIFL